MQKLSILWLVFVHYIHMDFTPQVKSEHRMNK